MWNREVVNLPGDTIPAFCWDGGTKRSGIRIPEGAYEVVNNPAGVFRSLMPVGQKLGDFGLYWTPVHSDWRKYL